jgi:hypothetical protein
LWFEVGQYFKSPTEVKNGRSIMTTPLSLFMPCGLCTATNVSRSLRMVYLFCRHQCLPGYRHIFQPSGAESVCCWLMCQVSIFASPLCYWQTQAFWVQMAKNASIKVYRNEISTDWHYHTDFSCRRWEGVVFACSSQQFWKS